MRKIRVFVEAALRAGQTAPLSAWAHEHLLRVLRLPDGAPVHAFNGDGHDYACILRREAKQGYLQVHAREAAAMESPLQITLVQALARGEKMDLILQKATELGVRRIVPLVTERTEVRLSDERAERRMAHWTGVLRAACEQCGRATVPVLREPVELAALAGETADQPVVKLALHPEAGMRLRDLRLDGQPELWVAIGPEGGFSARDLEILAQAGFRNARLGPRVLRTETAGLATVAALQALYGDCG